jgi:hypothetical protein
MMPDRIDPLRMMDIAQAESARRYRQAHGIADRPPPEPDPATHVDVRPFHHSIKVKSLWPPQPPHATNREVLAIIKVVDLPGGMLERLGLTPADCWKDPGQEGDPCLVLGTCPMKTMEPPVYAPALWYRVDDIVEWTKRFSAEVVRRSLVERMREAADLEREENRRRAFETQQRQKQEEERRKEAALRNDPRTRLAEVERQLAQREAKEKAEAAAKLKLLEEQLSRLPPA